MEQQQNDMDWYQDIDFRDIRHRFMSINNARLELVQNTLKPSKQPFLELLPLLFHLNHPSLPGYVSHNCPFGIPLYHPATEVLEKAQNIFAKSFKPPRGAVREDIHALYIMGSAGTIAFSDKSDLDIWICHDPELKKDALRMLQDKAHRIEAWADELGLEVHFFLVNAHSLREGITDDLSDESSGSAQHILLLEEFYRTSILLEGRFPLWWLVPAEVEKQYQQAADTIIKQRFINEQEVIDFGGLGQIPGGEFFGAAVWQLTKGINSPYKSVLKIVLTECYASEYPQVELLAHRFKKMIHDGIESIEILDPYLMLYDRLNHYLQKHDPKRLSLMQQAFYLKVHAPQSRQAPAAEKWRYDRIQQLTSVWGWGDYEYNQLDSNADWKADTVDSARKEIIQELTKSYQSLSNFSRQLDVDPNISKQDLTVLGRKLFAAFERKAGKIDIINRGIARGLDENEITLNQT
ncbi:MAG: class I adenylate cyclase, partial [Gammaproteobacteria bacterium]|nr:class I adenylate cyclase [Gammaproteobacteria bacterium]